MTYAHIAAARAAAQAQDRADDRAAQRRLNDALHNYRIAQARAQRLKDRADAVAKDTSAMLRAIRSAR